MQVAAIRFTDLECGDDAEAIVRVMGETIGLALSLMKNGDIEMFFGRKELDQLIDALEKARTLVGNAG